MFSHTYVYILSSLFAVHVIQRDNFGSDVIHYYSCCFEWGWNFHSLKVWWICVDFMSIGKSLSYLDYVKDSFVSVSVIIISMYLCMHVFMYVCMYVCMCVCMCMCVCLVICLLTYILFLICISILFFYLLSYLLFYLLFFFFYLFISLFIRIYLVTLYNLVHFSNYSYIIFVLVYYDYSLGFFSFIFPSFTCTHWVIFKCIKVSVCINSFLSSLSLSLSLA